MNNEQAWSAALTQLKLDMSAGPYNEHLRDSRLVSLEDGVAVVAVNARSITWLETRLLQQVERLLAGLLNTKIAVRFVAIGNPALPAENELEPDAGQPLAGHGAAVFSEPVLPDPDETLVFQDLPRSLYTAIVEPEKIVAVPRYLLRFLPLVGADLFWLSLAIRQARFMATAPQTRYQTFEASAGDILRWCPWASRASFWRLIKKPALTWLGIERVASGGYVIDPEANRAKYLANRYRIQADIPLTPMDADALQAYLVDAGIERDPVAAVQAAIQAPLDGILSSLAPWPSKAHQSARPCIFTVPSVLKHLTRGVTPEIRRELMPLVDRLAAHITRPAEIIPVSWYFLQHHLPELGTDAGTLVLYLRSRAFYNPQTGELRDRFWIQGGYEEIAHCLGTKRARTIYDWIPTSDSHGPRKPEAEWDASWQQNRERRDQVRAQIARFVQRVGRLAHAHETAYEFQVVLEQEPLTGIDQVLYALIHDLISQCEAGQLMRPLVAWLGSAQLQHRLEELNSLNDKIETLDGETNDKIETRTILLNDKFETLAALSNDKIETLGGSLRDNFETLSGSLNDKFETLRNRLNDNSETQELYFQTILRLFKLLKTITQSKPVPGSNTTTRLAETDLPSVVVVEEGEPVVTNFELSAILDRCVLDRTKRAEIEQRIDAAWPFISWLLYVASPAAARVTNPIGLAVRKVLESGRGAGAAFDRLARMTPHELERQICAELGLGGMASADWKMVMADAQPDRIRMLAEQLGIIVKAGGDPRTVLE